MYTTLQHFTKSYNTSTLFYKQIQHLTNFQDTAQHFTEHYNNLHNFNKTLDNEAVHDFTQLKKVTTQTPFYNSL